MKAKSLMALLPALAMLAGCARMTSKNPPLEVFPDMDRQGKYKPQAASAFFSDGRASRRPVAGTVAQGHLRDDDVFFTGVVNNMYVGKNPLAIDQAVLVQGRKKYEVYCAPCHSRTGGEVGIVGKRALAVGTAWLPTNLQEDRVKQMTDGEIFTIATNGRRSMHGYRYQVSERDRWAIVAYLRVLQRTTSGTIDDVPAELRAELR